MSSSSAIRIKSNEIVITSQILGKGAFKQVFLGVWNGQEVAVAKYSTSLDPEDRQRAQDDFNKELNIRKSLNDRHILNLLAYSHADQQNATEPMLLVMDRMEQDLEGLIGSTRLDLEAKLELMVQISKGMQYLHSQDVLHRDLKPMNILVKHMTGPNGQTKWLCKVNDFGLSKQLEGMKSKPSTAGTIGTELYCSPEVVLNQPVGARSDVYSAAMTFFQLLTGRHPYDQRLDSMHRSYCDESVRPEFQPGDQVPVKLQQLVQRMWRQDSKQRPYFAEVTEFLTDLTKELLESAPAAAAGSGVGSGVGSGSSSSPSQPRARPCNVNEWGVQEVVDWLGELGLSEHQQKFVKEHISGDVLVEMNEEYLKEMGITAIGHRIRIRKAIELLKRAPASEPPSPAPQQAQAGGLAAASASSPAPLVRPAAPSTPQTAPPAPSPRPHIPDKEVFWSEIIPNCFEREDFEVRQAVLLRLCQKVDNKFSDFFERSYIALFRSSQISTLLAAAERIFGICALIFEPGATDAIDATRYEAMAIWWLSSYCIGGDPEADARKKLQNLRAQALVDGSDKDELERMQIICFLSIDLLFIFDEQLKSKALLLSYKEKIRSLQETLARDFNFRGEMSQLPKTFPLFFRRPPQSRPKRSRWHYTDDVKNWSNEEVTQWLMLRGWGRYAEKFRAQGIRGSSLVRLKRDDLKNDLGVEIVGDQIDIQAGIERLGQNWRKKIDYLKIPSDAKLVTLSEATSLKQPYDVVFDNQYGYVALSDSRNHRVHAMWDNGWYLYFFGKGNGTAPEQLDRPNGLALVSNRLFVCDLNNKRLQSWNFEDGTYRSQFPVGCNPRYVACRDDKLFITFRSNKVGVYNEMGAVVGWIDNGMGAGNGQLNWPNGVALNSVGDLLVGDSNNRRVSVFDSNTLKFKRQFSKVDQSSKAGQSSKVEQFSNAGLNVTVDSFDRIIVSDAGTNRLEFFEKDFEWIGQFGTKGEGYGQFNKPNGVCVDELNGRLLVSEYQNNRLQIISTPRFTEQLI